MINHDSIYSIESMFASRKNRLILINWCVIALTRKETEPQLKIKFSFVKIFIATKL